MPEFRFCPACAAELSLQTPDDRQRLICANCGYIHYDNPTPVVAAIIEYEGEILLARNAKWPPKWFALVTGFLEKNEHPKEAVLREVKEEVGLDGVVIDFVGLFPFFLRNELIIAYHVRATGTIVLNEEIAEVKRVPKDKLVPWQYATGDAVRAWLQKEGITDNL
jgi:NADH pyrophosphatase NudC (nudix superfamily)